MAPRPSSRWSALHFSPFDLSTKSAIVLRATALGLRFVGGHPMAGRETTGYEASTRDLFVDRPWVVVPTADEAAVARVEGLAREISAFYAGTDELAHEGIDRRRGRPAPGECRQSLRSGIQPDREPVAGDREARSQVVGPVGDRRRQDDARGAGRERELDALGRVDAARELQRDGHS